MTKLTTVVTFWLLMTLSIRTGIDLMTLTILAAFLVLYTWAEEADS